MRRVWIGAALLAPSLCGCVKPADQAVTAGQGGHGRYVGVGIYSPGRMWSQLVAANPSKDAAASTLNDDEQVIVVVDSATGELRQCGNLSGYCVAMNPWTKPLTPTRNAPLPLVKHAEDLDREAKAAAKP